MSGIEEMRKLKEDQLEVMIEDYKKEIFDLRSQLAAMRKLEKPHLIKEKRRDIARARMVLAEKKRKQ